MIGGGGVVSALRLTRAYLPGAKPGEKGGKTGRREKREKEGGEEEKARETYRTRPAHHSLAPLWQRSELSAICPCSGGAAGPSCCAVPREQRQEEEEEEGGRFGAGRGALGRWVPG